MQDYFAQRAIGVGHGRSAASVVVLLLAGCAGGPGAPSMGSIATRCNNEAAQAAVGQPFGPALERDLRARSGASIVRVLSPGQAVTMEYNAQRVSLTLDGRGQVVRAACG